jgi:hypothetical protein
MIHREKFIACLPKAVFVFDGRRATCVVQRIACAMARTIHPVGYIACSVERISCTMERLICAEEHAVCSSQRIPCAAEQMACSRERMMCALVKTQFLEQKWSFAG